MLSVPRPSPNWKSLMSLMYYIHKEHQHFPLMWCAVFSPSFCLIYSIVNGEVSLVILIPSLLISEDMFKRCQGNAKKVHLYFARSPMLVFVNCGRFLNTKKWCASNFFKTPSLIIRRLCGALYCGICFTWLAHWQTSV